MELKEAYCLRPTDTEALINLGVTYFYKGDLLGAREEWEKALRVDPENDIVINYLSQLSDK